VFRHFCGLTAAAWETLSEKIMDTQRVTNMICAGYGVSTNEQPLVTPSPWITRIALAFSWNKMNAVKRMANNMALDFGESMKSEVTIDTDSEYELKVNRCIYHEFFNHEQVPHLTKIFCALDESIFKVIDPDSYKIKFSLDSTLASGSDSCKFCLKKC